MRIAVALLAVAALAGCKSAGQRAEERYQIASGDAQARCAEAKKAAEAYLQDRNEAQYRQWRRKAEGDCAIARLLREASGYTPD